MMKVKTLNVNQSNRVLNFKDYLLIICFVLICSQNLKIYDFGSFSLKVYHIIPLLLLPYIFKNRDSKIQSYVIGFVLVVSIMSVFRYLEFGFNSLILNYIFGLAIFLAFFNFTKGISNTRKLTDIKVGSIIVMILCFINLLLQIDKVLEFYSSSSIGLWAGHPSVDSYFGGGVNLDASWIGLFGIFFVRDKKLSRKILYISLSLFLSIIYASRAGVLIGILCLFLSFVFSNRKERINLIISFLLIATIAIAIFPNAIVYIVNRTISVGHDPGSVGRLDMWDNILKTFIANPLGGGLGNSVKLINLFNGLELTDSNLHNLPLQFLLDLGPIGFAIIISIYFYFIKQLFKNPSNLILLFICSYFLFSLIQFRGGDTIIFFALSLALPLRGRFESKTCLLSSDCFNKGEVSLDIKKGN